MSYVHRQSLVSASFFSFDCAACGILVPQPKIKPLGVPPAVEMRSLNHWTAREKGKVKSLSRVRLFLTPGTVACQAPQSRGFSRQEYCNGLPFPTPGDLPDPGNEPMPLMSLALAGRFFATVPPWEAHIISSTCY